MNTGFTLCLQSDVMEKATHAEEECLLSLNQQAIGGLLHTIRPNRNDGRPQHSRRENVCLIPNRLVGHVAAVLVDGTLVRSKPQRAVYPGNQLRAGVASLKINQF